MRRRPAGRRGRPLLRGALVAGAGYVAGKAAARSGQHEADQDAAIAETQAPAPQQYAPPPQQYAAPAPPPAGGDLSAQLGQLAQLRQQGLLTDEEFRAAKARLLG